MKFTRGNHYHQKMNWLHFGRNCTGDNEAGHNRKLELLSKQRQNGAATQWLNSQILQ